MKTTKQSLGQSYRPRGVQRLSNRRRNKPRPKRLSNPFRNSLFHRSPQDPPHPNPPEAGIAPYLEAPCPRVLALGGVSPRPRRKRQCLRPLLHRIHKHPLLPLRRHRPAVPRRQG
jgi:hypothetical protein